jgi:hypothetical protein
MSLAATSSAVTVSGRGEFSGLQVTVNQTQNLENQAVSVSWTGGTPTDSGTGVPFNGTYSENYLQIFECWGDPDPTDPLTAVDPGPSPSQCEFGGESASGAPSYPVPQTGFEYSRVLASPTWSNFDQTSGYLDNGPTGSGYKIEPFDAVDGTVVNQQANYNWNVNELDPVAFWLNPYFSYDDTNEIDFARTYDDGDGQQLFQVDTGLEAPGLGCGQAIQTLSDGSQKIPDCWLVIVPRGTMAEENPAGLTGETSVVTSPLNSVAWNNRIAVPLQFKPLGTSCSIGATEQRIVGSELATSAVSSWQPALCAEPGAPPYNYSYLSDDQARQDLLQSSFGGAGMAVFSDPIDPSQTDPTNPVVYAPLTLSGVVIGFNIERNPALVGGQKETDEVPLSGVRVAQLFLTPRLVAKLLTESYQAQLEEVTSDKASGYAWIQGNPTSLVTDPDFLQYNPEFKELTVQQQLDAATLVVEESSSDAASTLWSWVLADPAAKAWLAGDSTGEPAGFPAMEVNPLYSTSSTGSGFGSSTPNNYPKSDPYCYDTGQTVDPNGSAPAPARPICDQDWSPYALTMQAAAQATADSNDGGKTTLDVADPPPDAWVSNGPQESGDSFILSVTDSASAAQYGVQTASLSRAGDDSATPTFVAPDQQGLLAGEQAMVPSSVPGVLQTNPSTTAAGAYPLPLLTYAATTPVSLDASDRQNYATFLKYAAGAGQVPGVEIGQLPPGYVPLPAALQAQTLAAAATIVNPPVETPAVQPSTPVPTTPAAPPPTVAPASVPISAPTVSVPTTVPVTTPPPAARPVTKRAALSTLHTGAFGIGAIRWALPIGLGVGVGTALGAAVVRPRRRRRSSGRPPDLARPV